MKEEIATLNSWGWAVWIWREQPGLMGLSRNCWGCSTYPAFWGHFHMGLQTGRNTFTGAQTELCAYGKTPTEAAQRVLKLVSDHPAKELYDGLTRAFTARASA